MEVSPTEQDLINTLQTYYASHSTERSPLAYLKRHYGKGFKFQNLGLGKYGVWMSNNAHLFNIEKNACDFLDEVDVQMVTEQQLVEIVTVYFSKSDTFCHRKHVLGHIRDVYGNRPFSEYGYGTFKEFCVRHGLDMGVARRQDFRSQKEWNSWEGRRM